MLVAPLFLTLWVSPHLFGGGEVITDFIRGDVNRDAQVNITDAIIIVLLLSGQQHEPILCADAADANNDGGITIRDATYLLDFLFSGGRQPPYPFPNPGIDPGWDQLACGDAG